MTQFTKIKDSIKELGKFKVITFSVIFVLILGALFSGQNNIPPIDRDEARFAQASRQMAQSNDYINIKFQDEIRAKKTCWHILVTGYFGEHIWFAGYWIFSYSVSNKLYNFNCLHWPNSPTYLPISSIFNCSVVFCILNGFHG